MTELSRRAFAERLALAAAAPFILDDLVGERAAAPTDQETQTPSALARALAEGIRLRYPGRLNAEALTEIARAIDSRLRGIERLYQVPLSNGDEPDFVFSVYRDDAG